MPNRSVSNLRVFFRRLFLLALFLVSFNNFLFRKLVVKGGDRVIISEGHDRGEVRTEEIKPYLNYTTT